MRLIAALCTLLALAAAAFAGKTLWQEVNAPAGAVGPQSISPLETERTPPQPVRMVQRWPAVFGEPQPPAEPQPPSPPVKEEPQPPAPPKPPLASLGYTLKGVVRTGDATWAIVSHPSGERLLRVGEALDDSTKVAQIDEKGLWVSRSGDEPELLAFPE